MAADARLICSSGELVDGGPGVRFTVHRHDGDEQAFAVRFRGRAAAYINRCGHVPIELDWQPGQFFDDSKLYLICATHGALYSPKDGRCLGGRCQGRGLTPLVVEERDGAIYFIPSEQES
ncbi:MAG: Rieske 2Fe-2S domain-containing protein [Candidatus Accumulibacter sp.]|uniref:Rieske (2Fe-2S) protein n=1 Tax=Accumulibacter sp. TaxID=2053492 RepID=UPI001A0184C1|nr:Rieske 2Fe-2S domain-containing protein [Accumulibacter sp.]MBE2259439.1 Rieske 2Fe-2S domain-containing protein [Paracoccaceae bacterium]MCB1943929.1 Rieske 2Fe-2S domain-containing protein [Accumulibacter sp.]MCP5248539.1 Rieske 2Fe-2S domain-containing protein [Accumulibacter sp.]